MRGFDARLDAIEAALRPRGRTYIVQADATGQGRLSIEPIGPDVIRLNTPAVAGNPIPHLTPAQRAVIGPNDSVFRIEYVENWRPCDAQPQGPA